MSTAKPPSRSKRDKDDTNNPDIALPGIGNYIFQKTVGEGNFAKVKLASHKLTGAEVAIKVIDKTTLDEKKIGKSLSNARQTISRSQNNEIIAPPKLIETKSTVFLVMEYASGGELYDYLVVHGKMKEKEARAKFRQILSAVSYCHKKRVIHRDLKAENLLLDANLDIKIADFGFSNYYDPDSKLDTFCGSPPYAAPELFQGRRYTGPEVDVWSLGVILYVLTTGCLPFDGKNLQEMRESVCRGKYRIPFFLSDNCEKLLKKFLVRDPVKRANLDILIDDTWINEGYPDSPISTDKSETFEEDEGVIKLMEAKFKIERDVILQGLRENVYNDLTAIYYLLYYEKQTRQNIENDMLEITKLSPTRAKEPSVTAAAGKNMPIIGEDEVLPEVKETKEQKDFHPENKLVQQVASGRRRRAATVNGNGDAKDAAESSATPAQIPLVPARPTSALTSSTGAPVPAQAPASVEQSAEQQPQATTQAEASQPGDLQNRKRHNTIVGIFRGHMRRPSESQNSNGAVGDSTIVETPEGSDANKPRSLRFTFNSNTTSSKPPDEIFVEVIKVANKLGITHRLQTRYLLECTSNSNGKEPLKFEVEVCKLPRLNNLHGLRFKRLSGASGDYKDICEKLLEMIQL
ncbi:Map microtubule affinity-regulating kinase [Boothiomyces sp. JEL0866]|nr:Map microtubule affinity-regulating kinase [Boothiomyces sp. JEL0866]